MVTIYIKFKRKKCDVVIKMDNLKCEVYIGDMKINLNCVRII